MYGKTAFRHGRIDSDSFHYITTVCINQNSNFTGVTNNEGRLISTVLPHYFISNEQSFIVLIKEILTKAL